MAFLVQIEDTAKYFALRSLGADLFAEEPASLTHFGDPHATAMAPSAYPSTATNRAQRREHDRSVRRNRVGNVRGRR